MTIPNSFGSPNNVAADFRKWMTVNHALLNLNEIERMCGIPKSTIVNDLNGNTFMSAAHWYSVRRVLREMFADMPS